MKEEIKELIEPILIRFNVTLDDMVGHSRKRQYTEPRFLCWLAIKMKYPKLSFRKIGKVFGRDSKTISSGIEQTETIFLFRKDYELEYYFKNLNKPEFNLAEFYFSVSDLQG